MNTKLSAAMVVAAGLAAAVLTVSPSVASAATTFTFVPLDTDPENHEIGGELNVTVSANDRFTARCSSTGSVKINDVALSPRVICAEVRILRATVSQSANRYNNVIDLRNVTPATFRRIMSIQVESTTGADTVYGSPIADRINASGSIYGFDGADAMSATDSSVPSALKGGPGNDELHSSDASDRLDGGAGDDSLYTAGGGVDLALGGDGNDGFAINYNGSRYEGGKGDDSFTPTGSNADTTLPAGASNVTFGGSGRDVTYMWGYGADVSVRGNGGPTLAKTSVTVAARTLSTTTDGVEVISVQRGRNLRVKMMPSVAVSAGLWTAVDIAVPGGVWTRTADQVTAANLQPVYLFAAGTVTVHAA